MKYFRSLFKKDSEKLEYVESKPSPCEVDILSLSKPEIRPFLQNSISDDYFSPDSNLIPAELLSMTSLQDIEHRIKTLEGSLQVTTHGLFLEVMDHYDQFLQGLGNIQLINILLDQSKTLANESREGIHTLQSELFQKYLRIVYLQQRQNRLTGLIAELNSFEEICYSLSLSIKQAIRQGSLFQALELCSQAGVKLKTLDVSKYRALNGIVEAAERRKGKVYVKMQATLRTLCHEFQSTLYENVLLSYMTIATFDDINKAIQAEFMNSVSRLSKEGIEEAVPYIPATSIEQMVKIIPMANYMNAVRIVLKRLTSLMYNHHLLSRWHEENE
jgi:hypothetical protein